MRATRNGVSPTTNYVTVEKSRQCHTMSHTVNSCLLTKFNGGLLRLHEADEAAILVYYISNTALLVIGPLLGIRLQSFQSVPSFICSNVDTPAKQSLLSSPFSWHVASRCLQVSISCDLSVNYCMLFQCFDAVGWQEGYLACKMECVDMVVVVFSLKLGMICSRM